MDNGILQTSTLNHQTLSIFRTIQYDMIKISSIFYLLLNFFLCTSANALHFEMHSNNSKTLNAISATGPINSNDVEKLNYFLSQQPKKPHVAVYLNSHGGSLEGGIRLGKYFREHKIKTVVEGHEICASACALAFLGGTDRNGNRWMSSTTTSRLGFHSFRNADGSRYADTDSTQKIVAMILQYGKMVEAPMEIFIRTFQTPSNEMYWFSTKELLSFGIKIWDMEKKCFTGESKC